MFVAFKASWHAADLNLSGPERRREGEVIIKQMIRFNRTTPDKFKHFHTLRFLDAHPDKHRRIVPDARDARATATLFFPSDFLTSEYGILHKDSLLFNYKERALNPPSRRPFASNKFKPKYFWEEWDTYWTTQHTETYPTEWDVVIRPTIATLYKAGIIGPAYMAHKYIPGKAMTAHGADGKRDLYIDLRVTMDEITFPRHIQQPPSKDYILTQVRKFSRDQSKARFAVLRLWTPAHFYPLMVGLDRRHISAFTDAVGRAWEWNFVPKDMPHSETSMHHTASQRIAPYKHQFRDRVLHRRDLFIVMGTDEEDLLKMTTAAIFPIQTEPWRLKVDLWRSFIIVDMEFLDFLDGLKAEWLD